MKEVTSSSSYYYTARDISKLSFSLVTPRHQHTHSLAPVDIQLFIATIERMEIDWRGLLIPRISWYLFFFLIEMSSATGKGASIFITLSCFLCVALVEGWLLLSLFSYCIIQGLWLFLFFCTLLSGWCLDFFALYFYLWVFPLMKIIIWLVDIFSCVYFYIICSQAENACAPAGPAKRPISTLVERNFPVTPN